MLSISFKVQQGGRKTFFYVFKKDAVKWYVLKVLPRKVFSQLNVLVVAAHFTLLPSLSLA